MTTDKPSKDELIAMLMQLDEQGQALAYATFTALRVDPDRDELRALVMAIDPGPLADWLRAHEWLDPDPVFKLGKAARLALAYEQAQQREVNAALEAESGWLLDIFQPNRERPNRNN